MLQSFGATQSHWSNAYWNAEKCTRIATQASVREIVNMATLAAVDARTVKG